MDILVIGGTRFIGRHFVEAAQARGHNITLFNCGQSNADAFPNVEQIRGDRDNQTDLDQLRGRKWDAVLDTCGYIPRHVTLLAETLKDAVDQFAFISTISVYQDPVAPDADEDAPLKTLEDETVEAVTGETYGGLKVLCERAADAIMGSDRTLHIRPGMVVGQFDPTDRFTYWVVRGAQGGDILAPGDPNRRVQLIDARDLAAFTLHMIEARAMGIYNAVNPIMPMTWDVWMQTIKRTLNSDAHFVWASDEFLEAHEVTGAELPFWVPAPYSGIFAVSNRRAVAAGLTSLSLERIVGDVWTWHQTRGADYQLKVGLSAEREQTVLSQLRA